MKLEYIPLRTRLTFMILLYTCILWEIQACIILLRLKPYKINQLT